MKITLSSRKAWSGRVLAALMFEGDKTPLGMSAAEGAGFVKVAAEEKFTGQEKKTTLMRFESGAGKLILAGLGKRKGFEPDKVRVAAAKAVKRAEEIGAEAVGLLLPDGRAGSLELTDYVAAAVEGAFLGSYRFNRYVTPKPDDPKPVEELALLATSSRVPATRLQKTIDDAVAVAEAVCFTRDLVNEPSSPKPPEKLGEVALTLARKGRIAVKVMHKQELEKLGMGGILRVGAGSHEPPCLVHMTYTPAGRSKRTVVVIGKGITFDSGGLSIKPATGMEYMKDDMAGAASVFGLFKWLGQADLPLTVHGFAPLAENMPGGGAQKPGDIIRHYNGKTAEVISTDAEGRHLLADCLAYGSTLKPDVMLDVATLTGACVVALGDEYSALLGTDQKTIDKLIRLGRNQGEFFWQLPLPDRYRAQLKSKVADLKHIGKPGSGGTITAGLFLKEFVAEGVPWVHFDIAGPSFTKEDWDYTPTGATGIPVRTLVAFLRSL